MSTNKALIVLQENSGRVELPDGVPTPLRDTVFAVIDGLAETFEDIKTTLQAANRYDVVHLLTDNLCCRGELLNALVSETQRNRTIASAGQPKAAPLRSAAFGCQLCVALAIYLPLELIQVI